MHSRHVSLIDYRDLDSPEAMPSPSLGFGSRSSGRESSRPFIGNQMPSPPNVRASQSKHYIDSASPPVQEDMSPALSMTGAYQSGRTHQNTNADVPLPKRTRSPTIPSTSGGVPQDPAIAFDGHKRASEFRSQSKSEVAGDMPMHSPALKRTKIPLRSSPQVFEENLDSSQEIVRELLAKEKRLARFKDEVSQPVQSLSTVRSQKVPVKIQHPSTSGRQKLSEDLTTAGIGDSAGGNFSSDYEEMLSSRIVGLCPDMCPESERAERERKGDLDQYERLDGDRNLTSEFLAVKKYTRTAEREADLIRPMPILQKTMDYLLSLLDEPYDDTFLGLYNFLWDRMRAIRMDLRMQHIFNRGAINMLEQMIRLHIIAMHELCEYTKGEGFSEGFDAHLNIEQMNKTSVELFQLYDDHRKRGIHVPSEREFRGYYALLKLDKHPGYKVEPAELSLDLAKMTPEVRQTPEVLFARDVARACRTANFIAFFRLGRKASFLQACLMHAHFSKLRTQALASLHCGLQINQGIPVTLVAKWLGMEDEDIENLLDYYGFSVKDFEEPYMVKENAFINVENDFPVKRSKLVDSKRSSMIVRDVLYPSQNELCADKVVKVFQPKKVPKPIPTHIQSVVPVSTTQLYDDEMHDLGTILSPKGSIQNRINKTSITLRPENLIAAHEVQLGPASPLVLDFSNSSSEHHQSSAEVAHKPKFEPSFRNSFGKSKPNLESTAPITLETDEENTYPVVSYDSVVHTPIQQPMFTVDLEDEEQTGFMEEDKSDEVSTSYYDKDAEEARLKLMLRLPAVYLVVYDYCNFGCCPYWGVFRIWRRRAAKKRDLRERKQLTAGAALSLLSVGPPIWQLEVQSGSFSTFNINHVMSERREIQERSWSVLNPSEVVAPKLVGKNPDAKCLCWKLLLLSQKEENIELPNQTSALSAAGSWLRSKLMPENSIVDHNLLLSSPGLSIWRTWVPTQSNVDLTCCLSVIKSITFEDQNEAIKGANAVAFVLSEHIPIELQKKQLSDFVTSLPSGARLPLLILSGSSTDEFDPSNMAKVLGINEMDKSRVVNFSVTSLKSGNTKKMNGFLCDEHLRGGLEWLASESPPQISVTGIKTRDLVMSHLNSNLEILDHEMSTERIGPSDCISAFNEALDQSVKEVTTAARENPTGWPCPEIDMLDESSDEYMLAAWFLPSIGWSSTSKTEVMLRALSDSKLPAFEDGLGWLYGGCNIIGNDIVNQMSRLENCVVEYLTRISRMMGVALAQKEANIVIQRCTRLELHNLTYYMIPNWVLIFRRIFSWRLMNFNSGEVSSTYVFAEKHYFPSPSSEAMDKLETDIVTFYPPYVVSPPLDELVQVGYPTNGGYFESSHMEHEAVQPLLANNGNIVLRGNDKKSFEKDEKLRSHDEHSEIEENKDGGRLVHAAAKDTEEADKLSKLLEKCNILQNRIGEKLSIYF
ncbi:hypothetical protein OROMI_005847 [Orobanche minor]